MEHAMHTPPAVGDPAPQFALPDETGTVHRIADRGGTWTVVYFYPEDDTPNCTIEACEFRDTFEELRGVGADVWGISPDDAASHARFRRKFDLQFTLLSDVDHAICEAYGTWVEKTRDGRTFMGVQRATYLVGPDGRIAAAWPKVTARGHAAEVRAALDAARAAA
jgi:peroxiredoxin Q/BCP